MKKFLTIENFLLATLLCSPLYLLRFSFFGIPTNLFEVLMILSSFLAIINLKSNALLNIKKSKFALFSISLIIFGLLLSIFYNSNFKTGFGILKSWFIIPLIFAYLVSIYFQNKLDRLFRSIFYGISIVSLISTVYKIFGYVTFDNRLEAFYSSPNYLAMFIAPGVLLGVYYLFKNNCSARIFYFNFILLVLNVLVLFFTFSYGAWLSTFIAIAIFLYTSKFKQRLLALIFLFILCLILVFSQIYSVKFISFINFDSRSSLASRFMIWDASLLMIKQHPFVGIGPGNFQQVYLSLQSYFPPYLEWAVPHPHNVFFAFWLQSGILSLVGFLLLIFNIFIKLLKNLNKKNAELTSALLFSYFSYILLHGLVDTTIWKNDLSVYFWLFTMLTFFYIQKEINEDLI